MMKTLIWKIEDDILHLVINQPPANIMTRYFFDEMNLFTQEILPATAIKALLIYGNGRHFSAGADRNDLAKRIGENLPKNYPAELPSFLKETTRSYQYLERLQIPTFAAIRGTCFGSALELALCCKFRVCAEGTVMGFPETSFGLMPGCGGSVKLPAIVGRSKAIELIISGRNFSAAEAYQWGIVHKVLRRKILIEETLKMIKALIEN